MGVRKTADDLIGEKYGKLTVVERVSNKNGHTRLRCVCECGNEIIVFTSNLKKHKYPSCNECREPARKKHGMSGTRLFNIWVNMRQRCMNPKSSSHKSYYDKGITICDEWMNFDNFKNWSFANGYREDLSIDRIDSNKCYCPENCRWADIVTQNNNTSRIHFLIYKGVKKSVRQWAIFTGINYHTLMSRLNSGWSIEDAIEKPVLRKGENGKSLH